MKKVLIILLVLIIIVITFVISFGGNYLYNLALNPNTPKDLVFSSNDDDSVAVNQSETSGVTDANDKTWLLDNSGYEDLYLTSKDGLKLHNYVITNNNSDKWVIAVHGYTSEGKAMSSYAKKFYDMGYNIIIPDLRAHGLSEGDYIGMGWDERFDMVDLVNYIVSKDSNSEIVLFGVSMGAATVMNTSGEVLPENVKAVIEDCGYTSVWNQFSHQLKELFNLPAFPMMNSASLISKIRAGYFLGVPSSLEQLKKSVTPTLFIHGDKDDFVPFSMLEELYNVSTVEKEKLVIEGAGHAKASTTNPTLYWNTIYNFLNKYIK